MSTQNSPTFVSRPTTVPSTSIYDISTPTPTSLVSHPRQLVQKDLDPNTANDGRSNSTPVVSYATTAPPRASTLDDPNAQPLLLHALVKSRRTPPSIPAPTHDTSTSGSTRTSSRRTKTVENATESNIIEPSCSPGITPASAPPTHGKIEYTERRH
ncbi:hypothetical protein EDB84DRAFT_1542366 [Lactarius hengduanensis]|nr:hypothetical protein EDB84DRAFT_1542366 [Lactarius hengduanensis]